MQECLLLNPLAIEAAIALAELGVVFSEIVLFSPVLSDERFGSLQRTPLSAQHPHSTGTTAIPSTTVQEQPGVASWMSTAAEELSCRQHGDAAHSTSNAPDSPNPWLESTTRHPDAPAHTGHVEYPTPGGGVGHASHSTRPRSPMSPDDDEGAEQHSPDVSILGGSPNPKEYQRHAGERIGSKQNTPASKPWIRAVKRRRTSARISKPPHPNTDAAPQNLCDNFVPRNVSMSDAAMPAKHNRTHDARAAHPPRRDIHADPRNSCVSDMGDGTGGGGIQVPPPTPSTPAAASLAPVCAGVLSPVNREATLRMRGWGWCGLLVRAYTALYAQSHTDAALAFNRLADVFPNELQSLLGAAHALLGAGDQVGAAATFQRARALDPLNVRGMDVYAALLLDLKVRQTPISCFYIFRSELLK